MNEAQAQRIRWNFHNGTYQFEDGSGRVLVAFHSAHAAAEHHHKWWTEVRRLQLRLEQAERLLHLCWRDIFQTARVNQANLDGRDLACPEDEPCEAYIGTRFVSQNGVNASLEMVEQVKRFFAEAAEKEKETP